MAATHPSQMPVFSRGSAVLEYWLVLAEGLMVQPLRARVEQVVVALPDGHVEALIVRSRVTGRRRAIPAAAIAAVEPSTGRLMLDTQAESSATQALRWTRATAAATLAWSRPRVMAGRAAVASRARRAAALTVQGVEWLAPRIERSLARLARHAERATLITAERSRAALEAHHARRAGVPRNAQVRKPRSRR
jgi:hypothetical protein